MSNSRFHLAVLGRTIRSSGLAIVLVAILSGCSGGPDFNAMSPENIFTRDGDAEIRKAAIEDQSFPTATEPAS